MMVIWWWSGKGNDNEADPYDDNECEDKDAKGHLMRDDGEKLVDEPDDDGDIIAIWWWRCDNITSTLI